MNGLKNREDWDNLLKGAQIFLSCGKNIKNINEEIDMDYKQDERYIKVSFLSDYNIDLSKVSLHWWDFFDMLNGLSENAMLSRVRYIRNYDISTIKDSKEKAKIQKQKELVALKHKPKPITAEQQRNADRFDELLGLRKE